MMPETSPRLGAWHRRGVVGLGLVLALSGLAWMAGHYLLGAFPEWDGSEMRSALHLVLIAHGVAAYAAAVLFGTLLARHVPAGLRRNHKRTTGVTSLALVVSLIGSALFLYYSGSEELRDAASIAHQVLGVIAIGVVGAHVARRLPARARREGEVIEMRVAAQRPLATSCSPTEEIPSSPRTTATRR